MSTPPPPFRAPVPAAYGLPAPTLRVEDLPHLPYEAALFIQDREVVRGNRSRVVYLANVFSEKLRSAQAPLELVTLFAAVAPRSQAELQWESPRAGRLRFCVCFGGVQLRGMKLGHKLLGGRSGEDLRLEVGAILRIHLDNHQGADTRAMVCLITELPSPALLLRDRAPAFVSRARIPQDARTPVARLCRESPGPY
jgi:hypothetical protein